MAQGEITLKRATYPKSDGTVHEVEYDETALCISCGLPVTAASMGGTVLCPWCDMGVYRDNERWTFRDMTDAEWRKGRAREKAERTEQEAERADRRPV